ncbi:MAG: ABC transporter ATP-binding protein [Peptococcaceae bacterium]
MTQSEVLLQVNSLKKYFVTTQGFLKNKKVFLKAVDDVSLMINRGETLGLVGESGSGKTTLGRTIVRLYKATGGKIIFAADDITNLSEKAMLPYRKRMQMIFQDPYASLNPRMTVGEIIGEPFDIHGIAGGNRKKEVIGELLDKVGLQPEQTNRYPHELSSGQRQRVSIARAVAVNPDFIVCDEPVSALDVSIRAQILNLLADLQDRLGIAYLLISHDLSIVKYLADRVGVMYLGKLVELAPSRELYLRPLHPYTRALLAAVSSGEPDLLKQKKRIILKGEVPDPLDPPGGCSFRTRCTFARDICGKETPEFREAEAGHHAACHLVALS